ncbi:radical SAM protein [Thermosipho affectus]|uniref:Radical SAM protein n=1 Tax=Thermosipho affectus TaxID=660294 RepID=A0ABX3IKQ0_9BACT|nr:radical SAM protein [Thermosipho affectus]ONN27874.1 radical SAM protein [Thermosipho affectus]
MVLRASYGTLGLLGHVKKKIEMDTAYFMLDGRCVFDCGFCSHARSVDVDNKFLSRVVWKKVSSDDLKNINVKRICLQVVSYRGYRRDLEEVLKILKGKVISVSVRALTLEEIDSYFSLGIDSIGLSVDVVNERLFSKIRGGDFKKLMNLIKSAAEKYPGRITTHVIVGMGESDKELIDFFYNMKNFGVNVALFAFTPIKGTKLEDKIPPDRNRYRKIQLARYLIFEKEVSMDTFVFKGNMLEKINYRYEENLGRAFLTSGCKHCTRPYYNEKPGDIPYNFFEYNKDLENMVKELLE